MNLPKIPFLKSKTKSEYFLSLLLRNEKATATIFEKIEGKINLLGKAEEYFPDSIDTASMQELLDVLDKAISKAEESATSSNETLKTIFGLKETWVEDAKIKKEYLEVLKKVSGELGLQPIGFLTIRDAIINLIQKEEGAPVSAVFAEVGKKDLTISLIRAGKIIESKSSPIHETASFTVDALLKHMETVEILPARVIIFGADEEMTQEFISHQWSKSLPFLHLPQVLNLPSDFDAKAVLVGTANQMGAVVENLEPRDDFPTEDRETRQEEKKIEVNENEQEEVNEPESEEKREPLEETANLEILSAAQAPSFFGFTEDLDVLLTPPAKPMEESNFTSPDIGQVIEEIPEELIVEESEKKSLTPDLILMGPKIKTAFFSIISSFKKVKFKQKNGLILPIGILAGLVVLIVLLFIFIHVTVTLIVSPKVSDKSQAVTFSINSPTDATKNIIASKVVSVTETGNSTGDATGKKETGDKAKGTVTIFNQLSDSQTLAKGTVIKSPNSLTFTLDDSVTIDGVASHSADVAATPVTKNANVTAVDLGKESNLPSGTKFSVANFSTTDLVAKNDNAFSGGTKKEITIVSKDDQDKLLTALTKSLEDKARDDIRKKLASDETLLDTFTDETVDKKSFDKDVGGESSKVSLTASIIYNGLSYNDNDMFLFSTNLFKDEKATPSKDNLVTLVKDIKSVDENNFSATLNIKANLLPTVNNASLSKEISGKSVKDARATLLQIPQTERVEFNFFPNIPFINSFLPKVPTNIKIVIQSNG